MSGFWEIVFCEPLLFRRHVCFSNWKNARSRELPLTARKTVFSHLNLKGGLHAKELFLSVKRCGQDKTKFPYPATFPLRFPYPKVIKIGNPAPARYQNSHFPLLFWVRIPRITTKNSHIPHPAKPIVDPSLRRHSEMTHVQGCPRAANNRKFQLCWWEENMYTILF